MPHYFFNVRHDGREARDPEGMSLPHLDFARHEATEGVRDFAADCMRFGAPLDLDGRIEIVDERGKLLLTVAFRDALVIKGL